MKALIPLLVGVAAAGCLDFVEPELPDIGAPATLDVNINLRTDGSLQVNAELAPGVTTDKLTRATQGGDSIIVYGNVIRPHTITTMDRRVYHFGDSAPNRFIDQPLTLEVPLLQDVRAVPRTLSWRTARRIGSDTIRLHRGRDLVLPVGRTGTQHSFAPREEWLLLLTSDTQTYRMGASGPPPDSIVVPARWIPAAPDGKVRLLLSHSLNTTLRETPGDYVLNVNALIEVDWQLRVANE